MAASVGRKCSKRSNARKNYVSINVSKGQQVKTGDVVLILEAMKMEQEIKSSLSGTVKDILVIAGDTVKKEQALIVIG